MKHSRFLATSLFLLMISTAPGLVFADDTAPQPDETPLTPQFYQGLRSAGLGNSHTAVATGTDALYQNPAGMVRTSMYVLDGAFSYTPEGSIIGGGAADSKLNPQFAGGVAYNYFLGHSDHEHLSGHDVRGALAIPLVPEFVFFGAGVRYLRITDSSLPEIEDDEHSQSFIRGFTFDAGIIVQAAEILHLGLSAQNLIDHCRDDPACQGTTPTRISAGFGLGNETIFMATGEASLDLTSTDSPSIDFGFGAEYLAAGAIPLRAGFERRGFLDRNLLTFGLGWRSVQARVDFAYQHDLRHSSEFGSIAAGFSLYF